ncbi:unnamed protein product [Adineta ricciae]|uniref:Transglutaminase-like domain-containing protein n=1 Tax=Adineta ricciae TaxID=249248 RepID=A0A814VKZ5_ADIRI|nr:unnamed protein product [Adineta ricciae]CAF1186848.1 unnamed protein product [Adineta ricciae]
MAHASGAAETVKEPRIRATNYQLVWLAHNIEKIQQDFTQSFNDLQSMTKSMEVFSSADVLVNHIFENNRNKIILVIAGALGENTIPIIHDAPHLDAVFVFCLNRSRHEKWAKDWTKVAGVYDKIDAVCEAVKQRLQSEASKEPPQITPETDPISDPPQPPRRHSNRVKSTTLDDQKHEKRRKRSHDRRDRSHETVRPNDDVSATTIHAASSADSIMMEKEMPKDSSKQDDDDLISLVKLRLPPKRDASSSKPSLPTTLDQLRETLITITERKLGTTTLRKSDPHGPTSSASKGVSDRSEHTLMETIREGVDTKPNDTNELSKMFNDLKQSLLDTLAQQQPLLLKELIKETVEEAIKSQEKPMASTTPRTTALPTLRRTITLASVPEVQITADSKKTRTDAAFRQQRAAVVANKDFRNRVRQWSTVTSMADLVSNIKACGSNDLEHTWLLFCWIGQNIKYALHCNNNAAETVFRTRQGVCRGFASLYHEFCTLLGIQCFEISGFAKNNFVQGFVELKQSPHAWNSVVIDDHTYLVDPTWGAGGRDNEVTLEDFYFLTPPEEFIYSHYCLGTQLLEPEITIDEFLSLPVMKSSYYQFDLNLLSPKQGFNPINDNLFKVSVRTPKHVELTASLQIGHEQYPRNLHTLCQRDENNPDIFNCFFAPPVDGLYNVDIYAKTSEETSYQGVINMRLQVSNLMSSFTFPQTYLTFSQHNCILIHPLQRLVYKNDEILIHMIIPNANVIKIENGDYQIVPDKDEYKKGVLQKKIRVQGNIKICGRWDANADTISVICIFHMA